MGISNDEVDVKSHAYMREIRVIDEQVKGNFVVFNSPGQCGAIDGVPSGAANNYKKEFGRGGIFGSEPGAGPIRPAGRRRSCPCRPTWRSKSAFWDRHWCWKNSQVRLYEDVINAPTSATQQRTLTNAVMVAGDMGGAVCAVRCDPGYGSERPGELKHLGDGVCSTRVGQLNRVGGYNQGAPLHWRFFARWFQWFHRLPEVLPFRLPGKSPWRPIWALEQMPSGETHYGKGGR